MSTYIWINEGGESCCGQQASHGGMTLQAAIAAEAWTPITGDPDGAVELLTDRNHWIGWPTGTQHTVFGETSTVSCEYCEQQ